MATNFYQTADYLSTLANVCESAQRLELPGMDSAAHASGSFATANTVDNSDKLYYLYNTEQQTLSTSSTINHHQLDSSPLYSVTSQQQTLPLPTCLHLPQSNSLVDLLTPFPTPPPTPDNSHSRIHSSLLSPQTHLGIHLNPLTNNNVSYSKFQQYLDETWPEDPHRRGSAVIRASVYKKIADVLHGLFTGSARFKHWVKKSEFFLVEKFQPGVGYGACLAIPETKSRTVSTNAKTRLNCKAPIQVGQHSYKLVARLEDFIHIIGNYHNCQKGHHGIRKTYKMIKEDFSYVPRTAVAKFIELCDVCSANKHRRKNKQKTGNEGNASAGVSEELRRAYTPNKGIQDSCDVPRVLSATSGVGSTTILHSNKENSFRIDCTQ